jgi:hypothetical protein
MENSPSARFYLRISRRGELKPLAEVERLLESQGILANSSTLAARIPDKFYGGGPFEMFFTTFPPCERLDESAVPLLDRRLGEVPQSDSSVRDQIHPVA